MRDYIEKSCLLKVKDLTLASREVVVQHATYKTLDRDQDISTRGMFDKSWKENMNLVRFFLNHDKTQAPGKIIQLWDDNEGAYTKAKLGTHTLGDDTLKMLDEGIIQAVSFGAKPMKYKEIKGKGMQLLEVLHMETSVLTHWGAHDDSTVVDVKKSLTTPKLILKQLTNDEQALLQLLINNGMENLQACLDLAVNLGPDSDLYTAIQYYISRTSDQLGDLKSQLRYGMKEAKEFADRVEKMQKFIRNTTASDSCIANIQKSLKQLLHKQTDTADTGASLVKCPKCKTYFSGEPSEEGVIKCTDCHYVLKSASQPNASSNKEDDKRKALIRLQMSLLNT